MLSSTSRFQTTASGISQDSRSYDNMSSNTTSSSFVSDDDLRYFKQTKVQCGFSKPCPASGAASSRTCICPPFWDNPAGHRSVVCYDNPFSSQLVIYRRFVTPLDFCYWRKRYPPASVWNDLGSHKPICGGKRRAESTPFALVVMVRVMVRVMVSVIYHRDGLLLERMDAVDSGRLLPTRTGLWEPRSARTSPLPPPPPLPSAVGPRRASPPPPPPPGLRCPPFQQLIEGHPRSDKRVSLSSTVPLALSENAFRLTCTTRCFLSLSAVHRPEASRAYPSKANSDKWFFAQKDKWDCWHRSFYTNRDLFMNDDVDLR